MRTCVRCGAEMMECGHITGAGFKLNDRELRTYPIQTAVCPKCHEISLYLEDKTFAEITDRQLKGVRL